MDRERLRKATRYWCFVAVLIVIEFFTVSKPLKKRESVRRGIGIVTVMAPVFLGFLLGWEEIDFYTWLVSFGGFLCAGGTVLSLYHLEQAMKARAIRADALQLLKGGEHWRASREIS